MGGGRRHMMVRLLHFGIRIHAAVRISGGVAVRMATGVWLIRLVEVLVRIHIQANAASDERINRLLGRRRLQTVDVAVD